MSQRGNEFLSDFQSMAEQSQQAWQAMWAQATAAQTASSGGANDKVAGTTEAHFQRVLDGLKQYTAWLESASGASAAATGGLPWTDAMSRMFSGSTAQPFMQAFADLPDLGAAGPEQWMQHLQSAAASMQPSGRSWFELPAFGLRREQQEETQANARSWAEYMQQSARYQALLAGIGHRAAELLQHRLTDSDDPGRMVDSLRALYDLWIDCAEEEYAKVAMSDEFREIYGAMINAQMQVRAHLQDQVQQSSTQLGMPTRSEVNSLGQRLQELRRELKASSNATLLAEVKALRREVEALRQSRAASAKRSSATPKKATPKKAAPKKAAPKKAAPKKAAPKKVAPKKAAAKKPSPKKSVSRKRSR